MGGGKIIWSYVKPLLRGRILYAPNTTVINGVMKLANKTFVEMEQFGTLMDNFEKTLTSLANLSDMSDNLRELQDIMSSDIIKIAIKSYGGSNFEGSNQNEHTYFFSFPFENDALFSKIYLSSRRFYRHESERDFVATQKVEAFDNYGRHVE